MDTQEEPQIYLTKEVLEEHLGFTLTYDQYLQLRHAVFELASIIIQTA